MITFEIDNPQLAHEVLNFLEVRKSEYYDDEITQKDVREAEQKALAETARRLSAETEMTQSEIGDIVEKSQQWVSKAVNEDL
jgi:hypothetical protein